MAFFQMVPDISFNHRIVTEDGSFGRKRCQLPDRTAAGGASGGSHLHMAAIIFLKIGAGSNAAQHAESFPQKNLSPPDSILRWECSFFETFTSKNFKRGIKYKPWWRAFGLL
jgi:hypothetical protein